MKTVLIHDQCGEDSVSFMVVNGDKSHLNGVYLNSEGDEAKFDELNALLFDETLQEYKPRLLDFPVQAVKDGAIVVVVGFVP